MQILLSFLAPGANSLHNQICEVLDIDLIRQQAEHNAVDIQGLANYVITTMGKMCAPVRDEDIRELKATTNIVEMLRLALLLYTLSYSVFTFIQKRPGSMDGIDHRPSKGAVTLGTGRTGSRSVLDRVCRISSKVVSLPSVGPEDTVIEAEERNRP